MGTTPVALSLVLPDPFAHGPTWSHAGATRGWPSGRATRVLKTMSLFEEHKTEIPHLFSLLHPVRGCVSLCHTNTPIPPFCFVIWGASALWHLVLLVSSCPPSAEVMKGHLEAQSRLTGGITCPPFPKRMSIFEFSAQHVKTRRFHRKPRSPASFEKTHEDKCMTRMSPRSKTWFWPQREKSLATA